MNELAILCQACGLCCDGSLFGRVDLAPAEVEPARKRRLLVTASEKSFEQPCPALSEARTCAIYDDRPAACRRFVCRLYARHRDEGGDLGERLTIVERTRALLAGVDAARPVDPELARYLESDFARAIDGARPFAPSVAAAGVSTAIAASAKTSPPTNAKRPREEE